MKKTAISSLAILLLIFCYTVVNAQKLPGIQQKSMRAPANVKIDGKLTEWDDTFKAYNSTTDVFYTLSNDDNNLYLTIKAGSRFIANKLLGGGISFTVNTADQKKEKSAPTIVYPLIDPDSAQKQMGLPKFFVSGDAVMFQGPPPTSQSTAFSKSPMDSVAIVVMRKRAVWASREIRLINFPKSELPDSVISVYNELGIKAALGVDSKGSLALELAIPLKYLKLSINSPAEFAYNIKLNGLTSTARPPGEPQPGGIAPGIGRPGGHMTVHNDDDGPPPMLPSPADMQSMASPTDFWGKYTLAKN